MKNDPKPPNYKLFFVSASPESIRIDSIHIWMSIGVSLRLVDLIWIQSTSRKETPMDIQMWIESIQIDSGLVGIHTRGGSGRMQIKSGLEPQRKRGL